VQRQRLEHQAGEETQKVDKEFLLALEHGMPPAACRLPAASASALTG
jgi:lysyl-tRNA synthetase class II